MVSVLLALVALPAVAADTPNWKQTSELIERAEDNAAFRLLQKKYPQYLGEFPSDITDYASLFVNGYKYRGATVCETNDPRLTHVHVTRGICTQVPGERPYCRSYFSDWPGEEDPCRSL